MPIQKLHEDDVVPIPAIRPNPTERSRERLPRYRVRQAPRIGTPAGEGFSDVPETRTARQYKGESAQGIVRRLLGEDLGTGDHVSDDPGCLDAMELQALLKGAYEELRLVKDPGDPLLVRIKRVIGGDATGEQAARATEKLMGD